MEEDQGQGSVFAKDTVPESSAVENGAASELKVVDGVMLNDGATTLIPRGLEFHAGFYLGKAGLCSDLSFFVVKNFFAHSPSKISSTKQGLLITLSFQR